MKLHPDYKENPNFDMGLCEMMVEYRARHNMNQREFANKIGVSLATIINIETGRRGPSKTTKVKILDAMRGN